MVFYLHKAFGKAVLFLCLLCSVPAATQEKLLSLSDANFMNPDILPARLHQVKWMGDSDYFSWIANNSLVRMYAGSEQRDTIVFLSDINAGLADLKLDTLKSFPSATYTGPHTFRFIHAKKALQYHVINRNLLVVNHLDEMEEQSENIEVCEANNAIAYTVKNNLFLIHNSVKYQISSEENAGIVYGQSVHRNEFGINKGIFWSPKGSFMAFYRNDETMVADYPLVDIGERIAQSKPIKYPMAGMTSHEVTVGVFCLQTRKTVYMNTGEPRDQYLTCVTWDPSEDYIYITLLNRDQNHLKLNCYDAGTGKLIKTLFEEKDEKYVEPQNPLFFLKTKPDQFLWHSGRDGYQHLYLYNTSGELIRQVTQGDWTVTGFLGFDAKEKYVYIIANPGNPIENHIFRVSLKNGDRISISADSGYHSALVSASGKFILDMYSSLSIGRVYKIFDNTGREMQVLIEHADPLAGYQKPEISIFPIKSADGTDLYCRMIKPPGFDPDKKYPVFLYVYGGPHSQLVTNSWMGGAQLFLLYMAQQGYIVFTLDNRGTANRGLAFEQAIFRNLGTLEVEDQMKGVEYLASLPYVDSDKISVNGWSYGGFIALSMTLKHPGVFRAVVAGGPVTDWKYYEAMYGERYMDTPESNPQGYSGSSLLNMTGNLTGDVLIIHGTMDPVVVWQHSLSFLKKCIDSEKQIDYFVYPGHVHNVRAKDRKHLFEKIWKYVEEKTGKER